MKFHSLGALAFIGATALAQTLPDPAQPASMPDAVKQAALRGPKVDADGTLHLSAGPLAEVVAQVELCIAQLNEHEKQDWVMPNVLYETGAQDAIMPADLRLRRVSPVQALALVAAAAGCTMDAITGPPEVESDASFGGAISAPATPSPAPIIGYRFILAPVSGAVEKQADVTGVGVILAKRDGHIVVEGVIPGSPAAKSAALKLGARILAVSEVGNADVEVAGLPLEKVVELIRGKPGTVVQLTFASETKNGEARLRVPLVRERLDVPAEPNAGALRPQVKMIGAAGVPMAGFANRAESNADAVRPPNERDQPFVRVYALGSLLSGTEEEAKVKQLDIQQLIAESLDHSGVENKVGRVLSFHARSGTLIVKATVNEHDLVEQVINALKENQSAPKS